jgi:hypothetical protein
MTDGNLNINCSANFVQAASTGATKRSSYLARALGWEILFQ